MTSFLSPISPNETKEQISNTQHDAERQLLKRTTGFDKVANSEKAFLCTKGSSSLSTSIVSDARNDLRSHQQPSDER